MRRSIPRRQHEQILAAAHLRHQQELDKANARTSDAQARIEALTADLTRVKSERKQFEEDRNKVAEQAAKDAAAAADRIAGLEQDLKDARRPDVEALHRRIRRLEKDIDNATSLDSAAVALGATWQDRREQKMRYDA